MANAVDEHGQLDRHTLRIDVPARAHREIDAVESEPLQRPAELAGIHPRQVLRKEAQRAAEAHVGLCAHAGRGAPAAAAPAAA